MALSIFYVDESTSRGFGFCLRAGVSVSVLLLHRNAFAVGGDRELDNVSGGKHSHSHGP